MKPIKHYIILAIRREGHLHLHSEGQRTYLSVEREGFTLTVHSDGEVTQEGYKRYDTAEDYLTEGKTFWFPDKDPIPHFVVPALSWVLVNDGDLYVYPGGHSWILRPASDPRSIISYADGVVSSYHASPELLMAVRPIN